MRAQIGGQTPHDGQSRLLITGRKPTRRRAAVVGAEGKAAFGEERAHNRVGFLQGGDGLCIAKHGNALGLVPRG